MRNVESGVCDAIAVRLTAAPPGKMNGLGDGTRSDYADSKWIAHITLSVRNTPVSGRFAFPNTKG